MNPTLDVLAQIRAESGPSGLIADIDRLADDVNKMEENVAQLATRLRPITADIGVKQDSPEAGVEQDTEAQMKVDYVRRQVANVQAVIDTLMRAVRL